MIPAVSAVMCEEQLILPFLTNLQACWVHDVFQYGQKGGNSINEHKNKKIKVKIR